MSDVAVLDVRGAAHALRAATRAALAVVDGVSFSLRRGRTTALVGESGSRQVGDRALASWA